MSAEFSGIGGRNFPSRPHKLAVSRVNQPAAVGYGQEKPQARAQSSQQRTRTQAYVQTAQMEYTQDRAQFQRLGGEMALQAKNAISAYQSTQYAEERMQFTTALGVDEYV
ncbi:MAG: hypothetical protein OEZ68_05050 [Gammaproteobacteria bacterium]|nr:hypothetical protein [Gammaproteobacteria bacterium]MDH5800156.1 hypothetical protein [Gammaproteobacteria bacterium]